MKMQKGNVKKEVPANLVSDYISAGWQIEKKTEVKIENKAKNQRIEKEEIDG